MTLYDTNNMRVYTPHLPLVLGALEEVEEEY